jgi:Na+/proline symporter
MDTSILTPNATYLTPTMGFALMAALGALMLTIALVVRRRLVRTTRDFVASGRRIGLAFGVGTLISVWTWAMAVMMSSAMTYRWGLSGLFWFVVPNGLAVMLVIPFARYLRNHMPQGYTISKFVDFRFKSRASSIIVTITMIFGILLEIMINLKGTSVVMSTVFSVDWRQATIFAIVIILFYAYFGGLWTSVMTGTFNTLMITAVAAAIVSIVYAKVGGAAAVFDAVARVAATPGKQLAEGMEWSGHDLLGVTRYDTAAGFGVTLAFGLFAATVADQIFWQKVWSIKSQHVGRAFYLGGLLFYPIPITLGLLGLIGIGYELSLTQIGGDLAAVGPYIVSHIGLPLGIVLLYVLVILAACYSTIDGGSAAMASVVSVDIVKKVNPNIPEKKLFVITKLATLVGGVIATIIVLSGVDFTTLVLTTYALKTAILLPIILAIAWPRTNTIGFVGGVVLSILVGMPLRHVYGELVGTLTILAVSAIVVWLGAMIKPQRFDMNSLKLVKDELDERAPEPTPAYAGRAPSIPAG